MTRVYADDVEALAWQNTVVRRFLLLHRDHSALSTRILGGWLLPTGSPCTCTSCQAAGMPAASMTLVGRLYDTACTCFVCNSVRHRANQLSMRTPEHRHCYSFATGQRGGIPTISAVDALLAAVVRK